MGVKTLPCFLLHPGWTEERLLDVLMKKVFSLPPERASPVCIPKAWVSWPCPLSAYPKHGYYGHAHRLHTQSVGIMAMSIVCIPKAWVLWPCPSSAYPKRGYHGHVHRLHTQYLGFMCALNHLFLGISVQLFYRCPPGRIIAERIIGKGIRSKSTRTRNIRAISTRA